MPGTNFESDADGYDPQDQAETFDETNLTDGGDAGEVRSFAEAEGGEDDFTDLQARSLDDDDLDELGYKR